jgi:hypothetical protein
LSDPRILLCAPAIDTSQAHAQIEMLERANLPNAIKFVVTTGKFDAGGIARTFNVEANYPAEPTILHTLACWLETPDLYDQRFRDGYDLFCLRRLLSEHTKFDLAVMLRDPSGLENRWTEFLAQLEVHPFIAFDGQMTTAGARTNLVVDLRNRQARALLDVLGELYEAGLAYAITDYSLERAMHLALRSLQMREALSGALRNAAASSAGVTALANEAHNRPETLPTATFSEQ